jgi:hypothetical protein
MKENASVTRYHYARWYRNGREKRDVSTHRLGTILLNSGIHPTVQALGTKKAPPRQVEPGLDAINPSAIKTASLAGRTRTGL